MNLKLISSGRLAPGALNDKTINSLRSFNELPKLCYALYYCDIGHCSAQNANYTEQLLY